MRAVRPDVIFRMHPSVGERIRLVVAGTAYRRADPQVGTGVRS